MGVKVYSYLGYYGANNHRRQNDVFYDRGAMLNVPYWTPDNQQDIWARVESYETGFDVWEKRDFIRLDNVSLSYNIPQSLLQKASIVNCKLSVIAQNPYVWTKWRWMDPELSNFSPTNVSFKISLTL
jgi:hypothetical protein